MSTAPYVDRPHSNEPMESTDPAPTAGGRAEDERFANEVGDDSIDETSAEDYAAYRALSPAAVTSLVIGIASLGAFLGFWLAVLPVCGLALGIFALRRIAARPDELTGRVPALIGVAASAFCLIGGQGTVWYRYVTEVPPGHVRMTYDDLQPDPRMANEVVPPTADEFDGRRVFIEGYVLAGTLKDGIRTFILVRDKGTCCFGGNPKLTDRILVALKPGHTFTYTDHLQKLAGRFQVRPGKAIDVDGEVVYQLDDAEIL